MYSKHVPVQFSEIRRPLQRSSVLDLLDRPFGLSETACRPDGCSLQAEGLKVFKYYRIATPGPALKATADQTSSDKLRQVVTSPGKFRQVPTSPDQLGRTLSEVPGTFKAVWECPGTFRKQHQTNIHNTFSQGPETPRALSEGPEDLPETVSDHWKRQQNN